MTGKQENTSEVYSSEKLTIRLGGEKVIWKDMNVEITSGLGEHTITKLRYVAPRDKKEQVKEVYDKIEEYLEKNKILSIGFDTGAIWTGKDIFEFFAEGLGILSEK